MFRQFLDVLKTIGNKNRIDNIYINCITNYCFIRIDKFCNNNTSNFNTIKKRFFGTKLNIYLFKQNHSIRSYAVFKIN